MSKTYFSAKSLAIVAPFRASNDIRYYLSGVHVSAHPNGGVLLAATNGHQLCVVYDPNGKAEAPVIARVTSPLAAAAKSARHGGLVGLQDGRWVVLDRRVVWGRRDASAPDFESWPEEPAKYEAFVQAGRHDIEGLFPLYLKVITTPDRLQPSLTGIINTHYLGRIADAAKLISTQRLACGAYHLTDGKGGGGAIYTRFTMDPNVLIVTMPMRDGGMLDKPAEWLEAARPKDHAKQSGKADAPTTVAA